MDFRKMAITISPPHRREGIEYLYKQDSYIIKRYLNKISGYYILVPEVTLDSRLHYHGVIKIKDWTKYHKQVHRLLNASIGFIKLDPIKDHINNLKWICYMYKNYGILKDLMLPIIKTKLSGTSIKPCPELDPEEPWARYLPHTQAKPSMRKSEAVSRTGADGVEWIREEPRSEQSNPTPAQARERAEELALENAIIFLL